LTENFIVDRSRRPVVDVSRKDEKKQLTDEAYLDEKATYAVVTVPALFNDAQPDGPPQFQDRQVRRQLDLVGGSARISHIIKLVSDFLNGKEPDESYSLRQLPGMLIQVYEAHRGSLKSKSPSTSTPTYSGHILCIVNEPTVAAIAYGLDRTQCQGATDCERRRPATTEHAIATFVNAWRIFVTMTAATSPTPRTPYVDSQRSTTLGDALGSSATSRTYATIATPTSRPPATRPFIRFKIERDPRLPLLETLNMTQLDRPNELRDRPLLLLIVRRHLHRPNFVRIQRRRNPSTSHQQPLTIPLQPVKPVFVTRPPLFEPLPFSDPAAATRTASQPLEAFFMTRLNSFQDRHRLKFVLSATTTRRSFSTSFASTTLTYRPNPSAAFWNILRCISNLPALPISTTAIAALPFAHLRPLPLVHLQIEHRKRLKLTPNMSTYSVTKFSDAVLRRRVPERIVASFSVHIVGLEAENRRLRDDLDVLNQHLESGAEKQLVSELLRPHHHTNQPQHPKRKTSGLLKNCRKRCIIDRSGRPVIEVTHKDEKKQFNPEEISSIVLEKMNETAGAHLGREGHTRPRHYARHFSDANIRSLGKPVSAAAGDAHFGGEEFEHRIIDSWSSSTTRPASKSPRTIAPSASAAVKIEKAKLTLVQISTKFDIESFDDGNDFSETFTGAKLEELDVPNVPRPNLGATSTVPTFDNAYEGIRGLLDDVPQVHHGPFPYVQPSTQAQNGVATFGEASRRQLRPAIKKATNLCSVLLKFEHRPTRRAPTLHERFGPSLPTRMPTLPSSKMLQSMAKRGDQPSHPAMEVGEDDGEANAIGEDDDFSEMPFSRFLQLPNALAYDSPADGSSRGKGVLEPQDSMDWSAAGRASASGTQATGTGLRAGAGQAYLQTEPYGNSQPTFEFEQPFQLPFQQPFQTGRVPDNQTTYGDIILEYFISDTTTIPQIHIAPPPDFDPNMSTDDDGHTALHWACAMGRVRVVKLLLTAGADIFRTNKGGQTPLMRSVMFANNYDVRKFPELYEVLHRSTLNIDNYNRTAFLRLGGRTVSLFSAYARTSAGAGGSIRRAGVYGPRLLNLTAAQHAAGKYTQDMAVLVDKGGRPSSRT
ncbi:hypothetical protein FRC01_003895, partial [Tulasnella sp. 417]